MPTFFMLHLNDHLQYLKKVKVTSQALTFQTTNHQAETEREITRMHQLSVQLIERFLELDDFAASKR
jgi:hypothetical protein